MRRENDLLCETEQLFAIAINERYRRFLGHIYRLRFFAVFLRRPSSSK
jgi:hypothetical protein